MRQQEEGGGQERLCDLRIRRSEGRVVNTPLVVKKGSFSADVRIPERKEDREREERERGEVEGKGQESPGRERDGGREERRKREREETEKRLKRVGERESAKPA
ncbi:hypothetical protein TNCV_1729871 [Trichonephila clavipes]|nr:hypothetical protein TNCV_1729871 [Trichonephila clavipes]